VNETWAKLKSFGVMESSIEGSSESTTVTTSPSRRVRELLALCFSVSFLSSSSPRFGFV
jgi:hypothetical protein